MARRQALAVRSLFRNADPAVAIALMLLGSDIAAAHHSFSAEFDANTVGELSGVVTQVWFSNPHVRYRVDVQAEDGSTVEWELQMGSVTALRSSGFGEASLEVGDRITASGQLGRDQAKKLYVRRLEDASGAVLYGESRTANRSRDRDTVNADPNKNYGYRALPDNRPVDITGAWDNSYRFRVTVDDLEPKPTPFTDEGRRVFAASTHFDDPSLRCLSPGLPRVFGSPYDMEIVDAGSHYLIVHEEHNLPRRVYMDGRKPPEDWPASSLGFSVGRWEGDALVIETTHLLPGWLDGSGLPMSGNGTRIVERWEPSRDHLTINRTMTIYDPYYEAPLTRVRGSARNDGMEIMEQASCDPDSYYLDLWESGRLEEHFER
jgi:hypothetical protein